MTYKLREGLVLETICGTTLVIATLEASEYCPYAVQLNEASAYIWKMLFEGKTEEEMIVAIMKDYEIKRGEAFEILSGFLKELKEQNYLQID